MNVYRAATQSITHDEAVTYHRYVKGPVYQLVSETDANNHVLNSVLSRISVGLFGLTELSLRLPSVIAGGLFLALLARIGWRVWGPSPRMLIAMLLIGMNPFVLDYLSICRGYSIALMFWLAALERLLAASQDPDSWATANEPNRILHRASQFLALSILGNLTFALAVVSLVFCWGSWAWVIRRRRVVETPAETRKWLWRNLGRPGAIVFACLCLPFFKLTPGAFYFGTTTISASLQSMTIASFAHHFEGPEWYESLVNGTLALILIPIVALMIIVLWLSVILLWSRKQATESQSTVPGLMLFHLAAGTLTLCLAMLLCMHICGMKLPEERTGLYLLPPLGLAFLSAGSAFNIPTVRSWVSRLTLTIGVLISVLWALELQTTHYRSWRYDSDTKRMFQEMMTIQEPSSRHRMRINATWGIIHSLNFYRDRYNADFIELFVNQEPALPDTDVYLVSQRFGGKLPSELHVVIYENPFAGTLIAVPTNGRFAPK